MPRTRSKKSASTARKKNTARLELARGTSQAVIDTVLRLPDDVEQALKIAAGLVQFVLEEADLNNVQRTIVDAWMKQLRLAVAEKIDFATPDDLSDNSLPQKMVRPWPPSPVSPPLTPLSPSPLFWQTPMDNDRRIASGNQTAGPLRADLVGVPGRSDHDSDGSVIVGEGESGSGYYTALSANLSLCNDVHGRGGQ